MSDLNEFLQPTDGMMSSRGTPAWKLGVQEKTQEKQIRVSQLNVRDFVQASNNAEVDFLFSGTAQTVTIATGLTPQVPQQRFPNFAVPYVAVYKGTAINGSNQIFPGTGGSAVSGEFHCYGGLDWEQYNGTDSVYSVTIENVTAGAVNIHFISQWRYLQYTNGTVT